jgi:hypothetical protein
MDFAIPWKSLDDKICLISGGNFRLISQTALGGVQIRKIHWKKIKIF